MLQHVRTRIDPDDHPSRPEAGQDAPSKPAGPAPELDHPVMRLKGQVVEQAIGRLR